MPTFLPAISRPTPRDTTPSAPTGGDSQRSLDVKILALAKRGISGKKQKDAFKGQPWKANVYAEGGRVTRVKLDLDRDGKVDEKWTFDTPGDASSVKRSVAPSDDESYTIEYRLRAGRWVKK